MLTLEQWLNLPENTELRAVPEMGGVAFDQESWLAYVRQLYQKYVNKYNAEHPTANPTPVVGVTGSGIVWDPMPAPDDTGLGYEQYPDPNNPDHIMWRHPVSETGNGTTEPGTTEPGTTEPGTTGNDTTDIFDIVGATPPPEYEYWYRNPEAAWSKQLEKGGLPTTGGYGNFLQGLMSNVYLNDLLKQLGSIAGGGQYSPFGVSSPQYNADPQAWKSFINAPSGNMAYDYLSDPSKSGGSVYNMGLNTAKTQGLPLALLSFLSQMQNDMLTRYQGQGMNPSQNYGQYLNQYLGIR